MRGLAVLTVVFVFASSALFVGPASAQGTNSLGGMVCLAPYGAPAGYGNSSKDVSCAYSTGLPGAQVALTKSGTLPSPAPPPVGPATVTATTDANGLYSFSNLASGDYSFTVTRQGFKTATGTVTVESASHQDVMLASDVVEAKGQVTGPDGAIGKATVNLCCDETGQHSGTTATDGRYTVSVKSGYWSIDVQAPGHQSTSQYLLVDGAAIDFKLEKIPPQDGRIAGTVLDQDGKPVADARVALYSYGGGCYDCYYAYDSTSTSSEGAPASSSSSSGMAYSRPYYSGENFTFSDAQGRFSMGAYSGGNSLSVSKDGYAYHSRGIEVSASGMTSVDVELLKYPEKTAKIEGKVLDAKTGKAVPNVYVNLQSPAYGLYECSRPASSGGGSSGSSGVAESKPAIAPGESYPAPDYYDPGCPITTQSDGTFEGMVTPGYAILSVWVDNYASCAESTDADGTFTRNCGPEYYSWSVSKVLAENATTTFDIRLRSRPAPDAEVSGYVVDAETGKAIPNAQISFSNQDTYGWGSASTDQDGSYRLRLRSGYHTVSVWAEGHLRWEGVLDVAKGDTPFDVKVEPGTESYGGCCGPYPMAASSYGYAEDSKSSGVMTVTASNAPQAGGLDSGSDGSGSQAEQYQDLGGGLGPYDAAKREDQLESPSSGSPGLGLIAMLGAIGAVLVLRRRLA